MPRQKYHVTNAALISRTPQSDPAATIAFAAECEPRTAAAGLEMEELAPMARIVPLLFAAVALALLLIWRRQILSGFILCALSVVIGVQRLAILIGGALALAGEIVDFAKL